MVEASVAIALVPIVRCLSLAPLALRLRCTGSILATLAFILVSTGLSLCYTCSIPSLLSLILYLDDERISELVSILVVSG